MPALLLVPRLLDGRSHVLRSHVCRCCLTLPHTPQQRAVPTYDNRCLNPLSTSPPLPADGELWNRLKAAIGQPSFD